MLVLLKICSTGTLLFRFSRLIFSNIPRSIFRHDVLVLRATRERKKLIRLISPGRQEYCTISYKQIIVVKINNSLEILKKTKQMPEFQYNEFCYITLL